MDKTSQASSNRKTRGIVYTPLRIVKMILEHVGYYEDCLGKHILDNSCGDGAFLAEIVSCYCQRHMYAVQDAEALVNDLETFIHGIDVDEDAVHSCRANLDAVASRFGLTGVAWDIRVSNALTDTRFNNKMDFVVGNPPYVRIHNLRDLYAEVKSLNFTDKGMTDLYIAFFDIGIQQLNSTGRLAYITPSSYLNSIAGRRLRKYLLESRLLMKFIDFAHEQVFDATTYSIITILDSRRSAHSVEYYTVVDAQGHCQLEELIPYSDLFINGSLCAIPKHERDILISVSQPLIFTSSVPISVKNGFATLADYIFVGDFSFREYTIEVVKASTGQMRRCIFPYTKTGELRALGYTDESFSIDSQAYQHLSRYKEILSKRALDGKTPWYGFGRSQAIRDVHTEKVAISTFVSPTNPPKVSLAPSGVGVYGGLYITGMPIEDVTAAIQSSLFLSFVKALRKYKSGGYYTFNSADLKAFLTYYRETFLT